MIAYQEAGATVVVNERGDVQPGIQKPRLALVFPYYRNPEMLRRHLAVWRHEWPSDLKREVEIVIVDDGSPVETAAEVLADADRTGLPAISLYRMTEDRLWGQHAARNVGAHVARAKWLLMTDADHVVPPATLHEALSILPLGKREVVTFGRVDAPPLPDWRAADSLEFARTRREDGSLKAHVNSFLIARKHYWSIGGYDEAYTGIYGCDQEFRTRLWKRGRERHLAHAPLIRVGRESIPDASTRGVDRKTPENRAAKKRVAALKAARGESGIIKTLQFDWERVL